MEMEVEKFHQESVQLEQSVSNLKLQLKATKQEVHRERQRVRAQHTTQFNLQFLIPEVFEGPNFFSSCFAWLCGDVCVSCVQGKDLQMYVKRLKTEIHNCVAVIQEPKKLKDSVRGLYARHVQHADVDVVSGARS